MCRSAMFNTYKIKQIRPMLIVKATHSIVRSLVTSHLDYCNGIMYGLHKKTTNCAEHCCIIDITEEEI